MDKQVTEYECELLEDDLLKIGQALDNLAIEDSHLRFELLKQQEQIIKDLEIITRRLREENKCLKRQSKFSEF